MHAISRLSIGVALLGVLAGAPAHGSPNLRSGEAIHLRIEGRREAGRALKAEPLGWRLELSGERAIELADVTDHTTHDKWQVSLSDGTALLDAARFRAGHAYRVTVRRGAQIEVAGFVYLAPARGRGASRVEFEAREPETPEINNEDGIAIAPKSAL
jgi:hypothetical protein